MPGEVRATYALTFALFFTAQLTYVLLSLDDGGGRLVFVGVLTAAIHISVRVFLTALVGMLRGAMHDRTRERV